MIFNYFKNIFRYRELLLALLIRGFKAKYKNSFLGIFWSLLNPLFNVLIFAFIFTAIIKIGIKDYPLYLLCAIFPWNFFYSSLTNSIVSVVEDDYFVRNASFPIEMIPLAVVLVNLANFLVDLLIIAPVLLFFGKGLSLPWLYLPVLIICEFLLVSGIAVAASGLFVIFRDLNFILNLFLRLFFYFLPVIYSLELVPLSWRFIYLLNPLAVIIDGFSKVLFYGLPPDIKWLGLASLESLSIFILGSWFFSRVKRSIPERL